MQNTIKFIAAAAIWASAGTVFSSGSHAGGHGTAAIGKPGLTAKVSRTVEVDMADTMRFTPSEIQVNRGETVRFVVRNTGQLKHEFNLGTEADLKAHYEQMKKFPEMEHDEPNLVSLAPGKTGEVIWQFTQAGPVSFACLHVGHYEAGMKGRVVVTNAKLQTADPEGLEGLAQGEVKRINKETQKITLKHGEIKAMDMPPMTMVFQVAEPQWLDTLKVGDKVWFQAEKREGAMVITKLKSAPAGGK